MKKNKKYLEAANIIEFKTEYYSCLALDRVKINNANFKKMFEPDDDIKKTTGYRVAWFCDDKLNEKQNRLARVIALQLMYEMGVI